MASGPSLDPLAMPDKTAGVGVDQVHDILIVHNADVREYLRPASTAMPMPARSISARDASMSRSRYGRDWVMPERLGTAPACPDPGT